MELIQSIKCALDHIGFISRYEKLSVDFKFELRDSFKKYSQSEVLRIIESLGYCASYERAENFYKIVQKEGEYQFQFNMIFKGGFVELIWGLTLNNQRIPIGGGSWGAIAGALGSESPIRLPVFRNYEELTKILKEAFSIYEDFKREMLLVD